MYVHAVPIHVCVCYIIQPQTWRYWLGLLSDNYTYNFIWKSTEKPSWPHFFHSLLQSSHRQSLPGVHFQYVKPATCQLKFQRRGICHCNSKMMHELCPLAVTICLLPESIAVQSLSFHPIYPQGPTPQGQYDHQSGEGWCWAQDTTHHHWLCQEITFVPQQPSHCGEDEWTKVGFFDMTQALSH